VTIRVKFDLNAATFARLEALAERRGMTVDLLVKQLTLLSLADLSP
jgi:predicted DNA-binding ribbon-helix-helix protein